MEKLNLRDYTWNIFEIDKKQGRGVDGSVAFSMFMNNVRLGRAEDFGTVCDWKLLHERWEAMTAAEQAKSRADYFLTDDAPGLWAAFEKGDRAEFERILREYPAQLAAEEEAAAGKEE